MPEEILEAKRIVKVNSKGQKTKRVKCKRGYKLAQNKKTCVPITGSEKATKRKAIKKAIRTKKAAGSGAKKRASRKRLKAMKKRKSYNL